MNSLVGICDDFSTGLSSYLERHQYQLPAPDDRFTQLNRGRFFPNTDLANVYLQIEAGEASRELVTIKAHRGFYHHTRLLFGFKPAPTIFQQIMDVMLTDVPGVLAYVDDTDVSGTATEGSFGHLNKVFVPIKYHDF